MPSQEDYLDNLLKNLGKNEEPEIGVESEELESDAAEFDMSEDTGSEFLSENVEDLLEDAVSDLEETLGFGGDLDLNDLLEQESDSVMGVDAQPEPMDIEAAAVLEELLPEIGIPETDTLLEDAVADLETVLGTEDGMDYSGMEEPEEDILEALAEDQYVEESLDEAGSAEVEEQLDTPSEESIQEADSVREQVAAEIVRTPNLEWEEVDIDFEDSFEEAEEAIHNVQEEEDRTEQELIVPSDIMDALEAVEVPDAMDVPESVEMLDATDMSESVEIPDAMDEPEPIEVLDVTDMSESAEILGIMDEPESVEMPDTMDEQELAELSEMTDVAEAIELLDAMEEPEPVEIPDTAPDLEAVSTMSEDEIEQFLSASAAEDLLQTSAGEELPDEDFDLTGLLGGTDDSDLLDIQDMLDKADNNEAVGEEIEALLQGAAMPDAPIEEGVTEIEDKKNKRAQDRKRKRQEKAAAKKAAKEAKAAKKAAAKEGKAVPTSSGHTEQTEKTDSSDTLFDSDLLDSIVSGADQAGLEETGQLEKSDGGSDDGLEFDMDSLFGDGDDSSLGSDAVALSDNDAFPDFIGLKKEDDLILPEMENERKKKKGLLARFFDMLTEEDEDEESGSLQLSDENKEILNDLDKEKTAGKKKKKKKKAAPGQDDEEDGEGGKGKKAKKSKKPKPEKPKKEKEPEPEPLIPEKRLTPKKVIPVLLVCASLGVLLVVFTNASVDYSDKKTAHEAYYEGDYQTCYENLFGKELNETEQIMFGTSESILRIRLWLREYEMFVEADEEVEALDSLIQTVNDYPELYAYAVQFNAGDEVMAAYENILNILYAKYGLTEAQAQEIASVRSDYTYTKMVVDIVLGKPFGSWNEPKYTEPEPEVTPLPDELPEEGELSGGSFINNQ